MIYRIICNENTFNVCLCCIWHCAICMRPLSCMEIKNKKELKALEQRTIIIFQQNWFIIASGQASPDILAKRKFTWDTFHFLFLYHCPFYYPFPYSYQEREDILARDSLKFLEYHYMDNQPLIPLSYMLSTE